MTNQGELMIRSMPMAMLAVEEEVAIKAMSTEQLRAELALALDLTARSLLRLAIIVRTMEERGEDVSDLRLPLLTYLRKIACGQLLPQLVARFAECPSLISRSARLSLQEQQRLAGGEGVLLVVRDDGRWTHRRPDPTKMRIEQIRQVFAGDHLRSEAEQILYLESKQATAVSPKPQRHGSVMADPVRGGLLVGRVFIRQEDVLAALAELCPHEEGERTKSIVARITPEEHRRLSERSLDGPAISDQVRRALRIAGLI